jgi:hypothetical protein
MERLIMIYDIKTSVDESSLLKRITYNIANKELYVEFRDWNSVEVYEEIPIELISDFLDANYKNAFFLSNIKNRFKTKNQKSMADKIIKLKIDVTKLKKEWFFVGEKGVYADLTVLYNEKQDKYETNGMIIQDVPKAIYKEDTTVRGPILGNCKEWAAVANKDAMPGVESGKMVTNVEEITDDLPF